MLYLLHLPYYILNNVLNKVHLLNPYCSWESLYSSGSPSAIESSSIGDPVFLLPTLLHRMNFGHRASFRSSFILTTFRKIILSGPLHSLLRPIAHPKSFPCQHCLEARVPMEWAIFLLTGPSSMTSDSLCTCVGSISSERLFFIRVYPSGNFD